MVVDDDTPAAAADADADDADGRRVISTLVFVIGIEVFVVALGAIVARVVPIGRGSA